MGEPRAKYFLHTPTQHGHPIDNPYADRNYRLCRAINLLSLGVVLDEMVAAGLPVEQAACFRASADALLQLVRTENNRLRADQWAKEPDQ